MGKHSRRRRSPSDEPSCSSSSPKRRKNSLDDELRKLQRQIDHLRRSMSSSRERSRSIKRNLQSRESTGTVSHLRDGSVSTEGVSYLRDRTPESVTGVPSLRDRTPENDRPARPNETVINTNLLDEQQQLSTEIINLLGKDPIQNDLPSFELLKVIKDRWSYIISNGLNSDMKNDIYARHPIPRNIKLGAPILNQEVAAGLSPKELKKDKYQAYFQDQLGKGLEILSQVFQFIINGNVTPDNIQTTLLPVVSDSTNILCDLHHRLSIQRRSFINPTLQKSIADLAATTPVDEMLYGKNFGTQITAIKTARGINRDIKSSHSNMQSKPTVSSVPTVPPVHTKNYYRPPMYTPRNHRQMGQTSDQYSKRKYLPRKIARNPQRKQT